MFLAILISSIVLAAIILVNASKVTVEEETQIV
jgi:hypothetical protein